MMHMKINFHPNSNYADVDIGDSYRFIGKLDGKRNPTYGAVFQIISNTEKRLLYYGEIENGNIIPYLKELGLSENLKNKIIKSQPSVLPRQLNVRDRLTITNCDLLEQDNNEFSFEAIVCFLTTANQKGAVVPIKGIMSVDGITVSEIRDVELDEVTD